LLSDNKVIIQKINKTFSYCKKDPEVFLMLSRKCTELILNLVFRETVGRPGHKATIETYLSGLSGKIPERIILNARIIQSFGNYGVHLSDVDQNLDISNQDVTPVESALSNLVHWFFKEYLMLIWSPINPDDPNFLDNIQNYHDSGKCNSTLPRSFPDERNKEEIKTCMQKLQERQNPVIVLEDDPAGFPSNISIPMIIEQSPENIEWLLDNAKKYRIGYITTPSRSLNSQQALELHYKAANMISNLACLNGVNISWFSRGDSCLRGYLSEEMTGLRNGVRDARGTEFDLEFFVPAYVQQGRITFDGVQFVRIGSEFVPACHTEYARVPEFEYNDATLKKYLVLKYKGKVSEDHIHTINLEELRKKPLSVLIERICSYPSNTIVIFDAITESDLAIIAFLIMECENYGRKCLTRCSPGIIPFLIGMNENHSISLESEFENFSFSKQRGVIISGSLSVISKIQTRELRNHKKIATVIIDVNQLWEPNNRRLEIRAARSKIKEFLTNGFNCLIATNVWQCLLYFLITKHSIIPIVRIQSGYCYASFS